MTKRIGIEVLIEEVEALINVEEIATASPRLETLIFGPGDYSAAQGVHRCSARRWWLPGDVWHYARNKIVVAARRGPDRRGGRPVCRIRDPDGYRRQCGFSSSIGYVGKWASILADRVGQRGLLTQPRRGRPSPRLGEGLCGGRGARPRRRRRGRRHGRRRVHPHPAQHDRKGRPHRM